uniref:Uncharacterized protein n=1 Tax=Aegilops tauschii subsp. strangulata TaxID=200361 RepID=A0A453REY2_AEGTS
MNLLFFAFAFANEHSYICLLFKYCNVLFSRLQMSTVTYDFCCNTAIFVFLKYQQHTNVSLLTFIYKISETVFLCEASRLCSCVPTCRSTKKVPVQAKFWLGHCMTMAVLFW